MHRLLDGSAPVVSVCAPVGYGKTTLLTQYATASGRPVAWISLDAADDDPALLLLEIATALDPIVPIDGRVFRLLTAAGLDAPTTVAPILLNAIAAGPDVALLVDDLQLVSEPASLGVLSFISEHLPVGSRLVVASREALPLPLGRLRARGLVLELGPGDLALDRSEAKALLDEAGSHLEQDAFEALFERMEGWAAGFYLAALSLREATDRNSTAREFAGDDRDVVDYFASEVFDRQPSERLSFLLRTSILDRFTAPLCDAVLRRHDSAQIIDELERSNFFLVPLDHRRDWYRYHHLFSSLLRAELARREPRLEWTLRRRASVWHEQQGTIAEAVEHALAAGDWRRAAELYATHARLLMVAGRQATLRRWLEAFPDEAVADFAPLAIAAAWVTGQLGEREQARRYLALAEGATYEGPLPLGESSLESAVALLRAMQAWEGVSQMRSHAETAYRLESPGTVAHGMAALALGASHALAGRPDDAAALLEETASLGEAVANQAIIAQGLLALIALDDGRQEEAEARLGDGLAIVERLGLEDYQAATPIFAGLACLQVARGHDDEARVSLDRCIFLLPRTTALPWWQIQLLVLTGRVATTLGDVGRAGSLLEQARRHLGRYPDAGILPRLLAKEERALEAARGGAGKLLEPLTEAEQRVLELLPTHLTVAQIGASLYLSRNTIKGHLKAVYRKLDVASRAEAVARARTLRLLPPTP